MEDSTETNHIGLTESRPPRSQRYPWYDSVWLSRFDRAKDIIRSVKPGALAAFVDAFRVFRTRPDFQVRLLEQPFDADTLREIRRAAASLRPTDLQLHEARTFGRFVVHDHPFFTELQQRTVPLVSEVVGEPVELSYNFLSLYTPKGVCPPHLDAPRAKWTLDLCVNQNAPWPIYFSQVQPWPEAETWPEEGWEEKVKQTPSLHFTPYALQPGQAVVFSGSSQWHYRDAMPAASGRLFCELLFLHFIPRGTSELVRPEAWARLFGIPELGQVALAHDLP
jgi:hypothetical protein